MNQQSDLLNTPNTPRHARQRRATRVIGALGSASAYYIASLLLDKEAPLSIIVTPTRKVAEEITDDLRFFIGSNEVALFPGWDSLPLEPVSPGVDTSAERIRVFAALSDNRAFDSIAKPRALVIASETLLQRVIPPSDLAQLTTHLKLGDTIDREGFISKLLDAGFTTVKSVADLGELALKGAVIDLFPSTAQLPVRIELQSVPGEQRKRIVRMELFDGESQRRVSEIARVTILPVRELSLMLRERYPLLSIEQRIKDRGALLGVHPREVERGISSLKMGESYQGIELLQYIAAPELPSIIDLVPVDSRVCVIDPYQCHREIENFAHSIGERALRDSDQHDLLPLAEELYNDPDNLIHELTFRTTHEFSLVSPNDSDAETINLRAESLIELATEMRTQVGSGSAFHPLKSFLNQWRRKGYSIAFTVGSTTRAERLQGILLNIGTDATIVNDSGNSWLTSPRRAHVAILIGQIAQGFRVPDPKLCFIAENEIFGERSYRGSRRAPRVSAKKLLSTLALLKEGDYLVHIDYGVGIYRGLRHIKVDGILGDFLHLEYADSTLYLPAHQIGKVQKFVGTEGQKPQVDKLSSNRWMRAKQKVRESIVTLAGDLIRLYAARSVSKGWRFEPYGAEDERFSDSFPYDETPDQRKAIEETINDLAAAKPMDRLVCGDVGFGKTEVAIRAAFKCTQHARQVAVLVPTTILVEQHKRNFIERFAGYPVKIGAISRFYSSQDNQETLAALARGEIDIVIGTHRLLQHDVVFKDLGLLIIDEEHRFGVKQKERLRSYRTDVDVLTLTATPIPRTLHLSLLNIRDISLIQTAPTDRRVVQTYLTQRDDALVRDAILRELRRGGQAFYIHNRVQNIALIAAHLAELVPEARFDFAHGQMSELTLERIMKRFVDREIDVLIATTIIESGLDVPNANTIIIERADQFGLAQLYQLRGRVGRGKHQAFAYLVVPNMKSLTGEAHERLKVLQSLDTLGAGFNLAIRDLEIRGAGNLLGKEQSGSVLSVGFDMYCRILQEAVAELKGDEPALEDSIDPDVRIVGVDAFIPESYVPDIGERLVLYQRLSNIRSDDEAFEIQRELKDRFGPYAPEVDNLLMIMRYRSLLRRYGVVKADVTPLKAAFNFSPLALLRDGHKANQNTRIDGLRALKLVQSEPHRYRFGKGETFSIIFDRSLGDSAPDLALIQIYDVTERALERIGFRGEV